MNDICKLNDAELETVSGGMICEAAHGVAKILAVTSVVVSALGQRALGSYLYGMSVGIMDGACSQ